VFSKSTEFQRDDTIQILTGVDNLGEVRIRQPGAYEPPAKGCTGSPGFDIWPILSNYLRNPSGGLKASKPGLAGDKGNLKIE